MRYLILSWLLLSCFVTIAQQYSVSTKQLEEVMRTTHRALRKCSGIPYTIQKEPLNHFEDYQPWTTPEALQGNSDVFVQK